MEPYPRTTRPVGAEAAAGGAPATTQAAQRLGSGITDGHQFQFLPGKFWRGEVEKACPLFLRAKKWAEMEKARKGLLPERALKNGRILGQIGEATQDPPDPAAPRCAPEPELTASNAYYIKKRHVQLERYVCQQSRSLLQ